MAVAFALSRIGDDAVRAEVAADIARLAGPSSRPIARWPRSCSARSSPARGMDRTGLRALLADPDPDVVNAALGALRWPDDAGLMPEVASHLDNRRTAGAAVDALVRAGDAALVVVDDGLARR